MGIPGGFGVDPAQVAGLLQQPQGWLEVGGLGEAAAGGLVGVAAAELHLVSSADPVQQLHTACGGSSAIAIRETLDTDWGGTYSQFLPGQSFDITNMPNGTYYIEVVANPDHRLYERSTSNNRSLRQVILGGTRGHRTVTVPPYQGIDAP